jgi:hypothetical protein
MTVRQSAFPEFEAAAWPFEYSGTMIVDRIAGGVPSNPRVAEGWIRTKLGEQAEAAIQNQVAQTMAERGVSAEEAAKLVNDSRNLNGFKRTEAGVLYIEGRQLKAAVKEAASVAGAVGKIPLKSWGQTRKGLLNFIAEHVAVVEDVLELGVSEPTGINQRFVSTFRGTGIQYEEFVDEAEINFTIRTDFEFSREHWAQIWLTGGQQGIGATRSQGYGRYTVTRWDGPK